MSQPASPHPCGTERAWLSHRSRGQDCDVCNPAHEEHRRLAREARARAAKMRRDNTRAAALGDLKPVTPVVAGDWRMEVYSARGLQADRERKQPLIGDQRRILAAQGNVCLYCDIPIGTIIVRDMKRRTGYIWHTLVTLHRNWDHFVPFSYLIKNPGMNWALSCHVCNRVKAARMFETVEDARRYILPGREQRGYESPRRVLGRLATG